MTTDDAPQQILDALFLQNTSPQQPQQLSDFGSIPCEYIYNNAWYNLVDMSQPDTASYYKSKPNSEGTTAYYNFCQPLVASSGPCQVDVFAAYQTPSKSDDCSPASTLKLNSVS
jgi:hypothetical protein